MTGRTAFGMTVALLLTATTARADLIYVEVTNLQPAGGAFLTPVVVGVHDGSFTLFTPGGTSSLGLERLAEDGTTGVLRSLIDGAGGRTGVLGNGPIAPGQTVSLVLDVDPNTQRFLTFASMVIPSNDAFIGRPSTAPPLALFDANGGFLPLSLTVRGSQVWDAGTEVNDEIPAHTAFLGQTMPNTGVDENGVVRLHAGFQGSAGLGGPRGNILNAFPNADFTEPDAEIARIQVSAVPEPASVALAGIAFVGLAVRQRRRRVVPTDAAG